MSGWIDVRRQEPDKRQPVVYARPNVRTGKWHIGIAYWGMSELWAPEKSASKAPEGGKAGFGFTHWFPLPRTTPSGKRT
jgi:hypothetical protein